MKQIEKDEATGGERKIQEKKGREKKERERNKEDLRTKWRVDIIGRKGGGGEQKMMLIQCIPVLDKRECNRNPGYNNNHFLQQYQLGSPFENDTQIFEQAC